MEFAKNNLSELVMKSPKRFFINIVPQFLHLGR